MSLFLREIGHNDCSRNAAGLEIRFPFRVFCRLAGQTRHSQNQAKKENQKNCLHWLSTYSERPGAQGRTEAFSVPGGQSPLNPAVPVMYLLRSYLSPLSTA